MQRFVIEFVDNGYFCTRGVESERKMQKIIDYFASIHEATRVKVQKYKFMMRSWKCKNNNKVEVPINAKINEDKIKTIEVKNEK